MFRFRLEPVLRYRSSVAESHQRELAVVDNMLQKENEKFETLMANRKNCSEKYGNVFDKLTLEEMIFYDNYFNGVHHEINKQKGVLVDARKKVDEKRAVLIEAVKQKRIIETVKKRALVEYIQLEKKKEEAVLNDVAMTRFKR